MTSTPLRPYAVNAVITVRPTHPLALVLTTRRQCASRSHQHCPNRFYDRTAYRPEPHPGVAYLLAKQVVSRPTSSTVSTTSTHDPDGCVPNSVPRVIFGHIHGPVPLNYHPAPVDGPSRALFAGQAALPGQNDHHHRTKGANA
jgi:hypothetical protein